MRKVTLSIQYCIRKKKKRDDAIMRCINCAVSTFVPQQTLKMSVCKAIKNIPCKQRKCKTSRQQNSGTYKGAFWCYF